MKGIAKFFVLAFALFLGIAAVGSNVLADTWTEDTIDISELTVYANGNAVWHAYCTPMVPSGWSCRSTQYATPALERDSFLSVRAVFKSNADLGNVKIRAWVSGYRNEIEDMSGEFDIFEGMQYSKTLSLELPEDIDARDEYTLHVKIESKKELKGTDEAKIETSAQRAANKLKILSVDLWSYKESTEGFKAGSTMYADVVLKNIGNHVAEDVYLRLEVPELALTRTVYVGDIGSIDNQYQDAVKTTIALTLPAEAAEAEAGSFTLKVEAFNSELSTESSKGFTIAAEPEEAEDEEAEEDSEQATGAGWEEALMVISIILAAAIIVLLVMLLVKQRPSEEKPEEAEAESYY